MLAGWECKRTLNWIAELGAQQVPHLHPSWCTSLLRSRFFRHLKVPPVLAEAGLDDGSKCAVVG
jgi:hypothetical protein